MFEKQYKTGCSQTIIQLTLSMGAVSCWNPTIGRVRLPVFLTNRVKYDAVFQTND
jgi:hypothetical protein